MTLGNLPTPFQYWGKAIPDSVDGPRYHLLVFHSLDVAACGQHLLKLPQFSLSCLAQELGWSLDLVNRLAVFFLALHDVGKFSRGFQGLAPVMSPELVSNDKGKLYWYRHDTLGWLLWQDILMYKMAQADFLPEADHAFWEAWVRTAVGHHGKPPMESADGGVTAMDAHNEFLRGDIHAATEFVYSLAKTYLPDVIPTPSRAHALVLQRHTWRLAGLAVLADWLGSNQGVFTYRSEPMPLAEYWECIALPKAEHMLELAGLKSPQVRNWETSFSLFNYLSTPTPLQRYAAEVPLLEGAQIFLLEDVTGAGKTEAALILAQRMMQGGMAYGVYFALPSMATANQMYERVGSVYRQLFEPTALPSLVLSHGARHLIEGFRESIVQPDASPVDGAYAKDDATASIQCNAWLADNRKKALLADVGVGTIDQALLGVLPVRHQALRLLGLAGKVLIVDEVHAYDSYMRVLLKRLLTAHASQGGSAILLSATLPASLREELAHAYQSGLGIPVDDLSPDPRYPLCTQIGSRVVVSHCETRAQLVRRVAVVSLHSEDAAISLILEKAEQGHCVCWVRNTVEDACRAFDIIAGQLPTGRVSLFHSRFAMGDRLDIESRVLRDFGKRSGPSVRNGSVLIGTQVLEQSLDFCVDVMVTDLAPIDLVIQRAGRLQRHARNADGSPASDGVDRRPSPTLHVLMPECSESPNADWYAALFPKACHVYPNVGELWLGARALSRAGCIVSPGGPGQKGGVRSLIQAVYGESAETVPDTLQRATREQIGKDLAAQSQGGFNTLMLGKGYCWDSSPLWDGEADLPTRLGEDTVTLYLAMEQDGVLVPWRNDLPYAPWEQSSLRVDARRVVALAPEILEKYGAQLEMLQAKQPFLMPPAVVVPLVQREGHWDSAVVNGRGSVATVRYVLDRGFYIA